MERGEIDRAIEEFTQAMRLSPNDWWTYAWWGEGFLSAASSPTSNFPGQVRPRNFRASTAADV